MRQAKKRTVEDLTPDEQKQLAVIIKKLDPKVADPFYENLSKLQRALEGKPIDPKDAIQRLTNVADITERSRYPTYPIVNKITYCLLVTAVTGLTAFKKLALIESAALISHKGESRKEYTEQMKAASGQADQQTITFGNQMQQEAKKRLGWLRGKPKEEKSEFVYQ